MAFLFRPTLAEMAEALAEVMRDGYLNPAEGPKGPRPAPAPPSAGAPHPPGRALALAVYAEPVYLTCFHTGGETRCVS